jgi:putative transposase
MKQWQSLAHVRWGCQLSHSVVRPKYRKKVMYGRTRRAIGKILPQLRRRKGVEIVEGRATSDHIHLLLSIPPKSGVATVGVYLKEKSAIQIHR